MRRTRIRRRLLIYSHDTFGLGHLRRCREIAHAAVGHSPDVSVLILSGSPIIGSFAFRGRVDFVRVPGVIKLRRGNYTPLSLDMGIQEILALRSSIIEHTAATFAPDVFLVDKEPWGLRGEVKGTLRLLKERGVPLVLGLRDVMDDPLMLAREWERKGAINAINNYYDHVWVYGLPEICDPLAGLPVSEATREKIQYTGYIRRSFNGADAAPLTVPADCRPPYLLVTTGGGGDGAVLIDWVLRAYEEDPEIPYAALLVLGPFMHTTVQAEFMTRVNRLRQVHAITFEANIEQLIAASAGVVAMGGYNTFCEILSFDKPALIAPRKTPRREQYIRAVRACALGLVDTIDADGDRPAELMARKLRSLPSHRRPSAVKIPGLLDGLDVINGFLDEWFQRAWQSSGHHLRLVETIR
jgi:predicted glycosyltransferase